MTASHPPPLRLPPPSPSVQGGASRFLRRAGGLRRHLHQHHHRSAGALVVRGTLGPLGWSMDLLDYVAIVAGSTALVLAGRLRQAIDGRRSGQEADDWWGENAGKALLVWAVLEGAALAGAIVLFATGHVTVYAVLVTFVLAGLVLTSPGRLARV